MKRPRRCIVCRKPDTSVFAETLRAYSGLCLACCRSYDRARDKDATALAIIAWAAKRAWGASQVSRKDRRP